MPGLPVANRYVTFLDIIQYSNAHILLVACALSSSAPLLLNHEVNVWVVVCSSAGAFFVYLLDRGIWIAREDLVNHPGRVEWVSSHKAFIYISLVAALILALLALYQIERKVVIGFLTLGMLGIVYILPWWKQGITPKKWGILKVICIAGAWVVGGVMLPLFATGATLTLQEWLFCLYRFVFLCANVILADWPDVAGDQAMGFHSVASDLGYHGVRTLTFGLCLLGMCLGVFLAINGANLFYWGMDLIGGMAMLLLAYRLAIIPDSRYAFRIDCLVAWPVILWPLSLI